MSYVPLFKLLPEVAMKETRTIVVLKPDAYGIPRGEYSLVEMFCDDEDCDCRRVFLTVISSITKKPVAVLTFGWESKQFYTSWFTMGKSMDFSAMNSFDQENVNFMCGIHLSPTSRQSSIAPAVLKMVTEQALNDKAYVTRLKQHYKLFRAVIDQR